MIYVTITSEEARKRLNEAIEEAKDVKWYIRLKIIALSATKQTVEELSQMFNLCEATIRNYIHDYNKGGLEQLAPHKPTGRPPTIGSWTKEQWDKVLEQTPNQYEKLNTQSRQWTLERLQQYVKEYHGIDVCLSSVYNSIRKTGRRMGRSKLRVGSPDPMYAVKRSYTKEVQNLHSWDN
jgi:transposase